MNLVIIDRETGREVLDLGSADCFQDLGYVERDWKELEKTLHHEKMNMMSKIIVNTAMSPSSYDDVKQAVAEIEESMVYHVDNLISMGKKLLLSYILSDGRYDFDIR
jgi:hypothetical protein